MPVDLNALMGRVAALPDNERMHVSAQGDLQRGTGLKGLRRILIWARSAESRQAAAAFKNAIAAHPVYQAFAAEVNGPLDALIAKSKPLTAARVRETLRTLDLASALQTGRALAGDAAMPQAQRRLPLGYGADFAQFCIRNDLRTSTDQERAAALGGYLKGVLIPASCRALSRLPAGTAPEAAALMERVHGPAQEFLRRTVDRLLAGGLQGFTLQALENAWAAECAQDLALVSHLSAGTMASIRESGRAGEILAALHEALPVVGVNRLDDLSQELYASPSLASQAERCEAIKRFLVNSQAAGVAADIVSKTGLPEGFASALAHNPEVVEETLAAFAAGPLPTPEAVAAKLSANMSQFVLANSGQLDQLAGLVGKAVPGLASALTSQTLPRYVNIVLASRPIINALRNIGAVPEAQILADLQRFAVAMKSATHSVRGDFGADDMLATINDSLRIALALESVDGQDLLEMGTTLLTRFAQIACDINAINDAAVSSRFGDAGVRLWLDDGMTMCLAVESFGKAVLDSMTAAQREAIGAGGYGQDPASKIDFTTRHFEASRRLEDIGSAVRDLAVSRGLVLPAPSGSQASRAAETLLAENQAMARMVLHTFVHPEAHGFAPDFVQGQIGSNSLGGIDARTITFARLQDDVERSLDVYVRDAARAGERLSSELITRHITAATRQALARLRSIFAEIDGLPAFGMGEDGPSGFDAPDKAFLKDLVIRTGMRDVNLLTELAELSRRSNVPSFMADLASPLITARQLSRSLTPFATQFSDAAGALANDLKGQGQALTAFFSCIVHFINFGQNELRMLRDNLASDTTRQAAGSYLWVASQPRARDRDGAGLRARMINVIASVVQRELTGTEANAPHYGTAVTGIEQIPSGPDGMMLPIQALTGRELVGSVDVLLGHVWPRPTAQERAAVKATCAHYARAAAAAPTCGNLFENWICDLAPEIARLYAANGNQPPSLRQLWDLLTAGRIGRIPGRILKTNDASAMIEAIGAGYGQLVHALLPQLSVQAGQARLMQLVQAHIPLGRLFDALRGTPVSLQDLRVDTGMGSLLAITPENGYGLCTDLTRWGRRTQFTMRLADGRQLLLRPRDAGTQDINRNDPIVSNIVGFWRDMSGGNEAMLRRIGQVFSQASLIVPRVVSQVFPGLFISEHGETLVTAQQQADGSVVVDVSSLPDDPVLLTERIVIEPDGTHRFTQFAMGRRP